VNSVSHNIFYILILILLPVISSGEEGFHLLATMSEDSTVDQFSVVAGVGDVNGDGYSDLAIGYGRYPDCPDTSRANCHRIDIYLGGDTLDINPDMTFWDALDIWGNMDLNGDGIFTTTSKSCINVDGITNPRATPHFPFIFY
jgi:hypothetical protein